MLSQKRPLEEHDEDVVDLLDEAEALELVEFDPKVDPKDTWRAPQVTATFLERYFNRSLSTEERGAIMKDFPRPNCDVVVTLKMYEEVKSRRGRMHSLAPRRHNTGFKNNSWTQLVHLLVFGLISSTRMLWCPRKTS